MMRVAISAENGFRLSDEAILLCAEKGMTLAPPLPEGVHQFAPGFDFFTWCDREMVIDGQQYGTHNEFSNEFRTNPIVLAVLQQLGERAMLPLHGSPRVFKIVETPFDSTEGWHIRDCECDTGEYVVENHRTWD